MLGMAAWPPDAAVANQDETVARTGGQAYHPAVSFILHIIDEATDQDCLDQLALLAGPHDAIVSAGRPPQMAQLGRPVRVVHRLPGAAWLCGRRIVDIAGAADFVHAWSPSAGCVAQTVAEALGVKLLISLPCVPALPVIRRLARPVAEAGAALTVPTQHARKAMHAAGIVESAVKVLRPPALPTDNAEQRRRSTRQGLGLGDDERLCLALGPITRAAGHKYAIWAHAVVRHVIGKLRLIVPGRGPADQDVRVFAASGGFEDDLLFTGSRFSMPDILAAADLGLFLPGQDYGVSVLVSAMAAGLAVVAAGTPDVVECSDGGQAALLTKRSDPRSASAGMLILLDNADIAARLGGAAMSHAETNFSVRLSRRQLGEIYATV